jgi:Do/DeqQ family serine protease
MRVEFFARCLGLSVLAIPVIAHSAGATPIASGTDKTQKAQELSEAVISVAEKVSPSVVEVDVTIRDDSADQLPYWLRRRNDSPVIKGNGSGVILTSDGYILTNNHVVERALTIAVKTKDGKLLPASVRGRDPGTDLAVIKIEAAGLTPAKMGNSDAARVGEWVIAVGSPFGLSYSVTTGVLSAKGRGGLGMNSVEDYLQTDASINPGNSGGPLVNLSGEVLGINTMIVGSNTGIGFAVPAQIAKRVSDQLIKNGRVQRAWLGISGQDLTPDLAKAFSTTPYAGVLINDVLPKTPAETAHLWAGDIVSKIGGKQLREYQDLLREVNNLDVGTSVELVVLREGIPYITKAILTAKPEETVKPTPSEEIKSSSQSGYGLTLKPIPADVIAKADLDGKAQVYISTVDTASAADKAGLQPNDVILQCEKAANPTLDQIKSASARGTILLRVQRREAKFFVILSK